MDTFASIALCSEPPRPGVMRQPPKRRDESILTRPMLVTIFTTAAFFVVVMMTLLAGMEWYGWFAGASGDRSTEFPELTVRQVSIFFSVYVFFQVWNQINCRSLTPDESGLSGLGRNPTFLVIAGTVALVQVLIVSVPFLASVFKVEPLGLVDWLWVVVGTASVLAFSELAGFVRRALNRAGVSQPVGAAPQTNRAARLIVGRPACFGGLSLLHDLGHGRLTDPPEALASGSGWYHDRRGCSRPPTDRRPEPRTAGLKQPSL